MSAIKIDVYLATPYTHPDPAVQQWRYQRVTEAAAFLIKGGCKSLYSPITHTHPIDRHLIEQQQNHTFWVEDFDMPFLANSKRITILMLPGWDKSVGVRMEIKHAGNLAIPVVFVRPQYDEMFRIIGLNEVCD